MKKFYTILIGLLLISTFLNAQVFQSNFESWTTGNPDGWVGLKTSLEDDSIMQITSGAVFGSNACQLVNTESSHKRFTTQQLTVTAATSYEIKFWVKGKGNIRTSLFDVDWNGYNSYINVNTTSWTEYSQTVTASAASDTAEFIISVQYTEATDHIQLDSVVISETTVSFVSIHDIQGEMVVSPYNGQVVNTGGIVTGVLFNNRFFIQSGSGGWNGVYVYDDSYTPEEGDSVTFTALVDEFNTYTELTNVAGYVRHSQSNPTPLPVSVTIGTISEKHEGVLVTIVNAECTVLPDSYGVWEINDGSAACKVDDDIYNNTFTPTLNDHYTITGIEHNPYNEWVILPRDASDIIAGVNEIISKDTFRIFPVPANEKISIISGSPIISIELFNVIGELVYNKTCFSKKKISFDVTDFETGVYMLKVNYNKTSSVYKVVVE